MIYIQCCYARPPVSQSFRLIKFILLLLLDSMNE